MFALKRSLHAFAIGLFGFFLRFLPDRIPMTFLGANATAELLASMAQTGVKRPLVVTDAGLVAAGLVDRLSASIADAGLECSIYAGVEPDPTFNQVEDGLSQFFDDDCDAILALGGGSSMDAAKVIAAASRNGRDARKLEGTMKVRKPIARLFAIPTTAGTGSEATYAAVISEPKTHVKKFFVDPKILPEMVALDPTVMLGLPKPITSATGMDALTHAVESILSRTSNPQTERWAFSAVQLIFTHLPRAYANGGDEEARSAMTLASYYAGLAFTRTGVGYVHAIAHTFGAYYRTPHGLANAIALPHVLEFSMPASQARLAQLGETIGVKGSSEAARAEGFIEAVRELMQEIEIPAVLGSLRQDDIPAIVTQALSEANLSYPVPRYMSQQDGERLVNAMVG